MILTSYNLYQNLFEFFKNNHFFSKICKIPDFLGFFGKNHNILDKENIFSRTFQISSALFQGFHFFQDYSWIQDVFSTELKNLDFFRTVTTMFILRNYSQHPIQDNLCPKRAGHHRPSLPPSVKHINTKYIYGSDHETVAVLLPGFAINW